MTSFIPSLNIPDAVFTNQAASILLPIVLGGITGHTCSREEPHANGVLLLMLAARNKRAAALKIRQPPGMPPPKAFPIAWTGLYALMGYAANRAITAGLSSPLASDMTLARKCATLYTVQLGLNVIWMPLFFVAHRPIEATVDIVSLVGINSCLVYTMGQLDTISGWCMVPYVAWLGFASYLCAGAGVLNGWNFSKKARED
ncbi:TspO/MBR-related protein [Ceratocystis lukuohia]|uniref:TspO/MBR-related protein n=1 Tax=Ceratocystis lukuohia TaxID=2019550 RepID=A0ABR4MLU0_9PEZI